MRKGLLPRNSNSLWLVGIDGFSPGVSGEYLSAFNGTSPNTDPTRSLIWPWEIAHIGNLFCWTGGGISICAGRYFATAEVLLAISMIISRFEIDRIGWVKRDALLLREPPKMICRMRTQ